MMAKLYSVEGLEKGRLSIMPHPQGGARLEKEIRALREAGVDVLISLLDDDEIEELHLEEEKSCCEAQNIRFFHLPVPDMSAPGVHEEVVSFLKDLAAMLAENRHVVFHCQMGIGRSATFAAAVLVLSGYTARRAFELLSAARGLPVPETPPQRLWVRLVQAEYEKELKDCSDAGS